jgi:hypothetical protein
MEADVEARVTTRIADNIAAEDSRHYTKTSEDRRLRPVVAGWRAKEGRLQTEGNQGSEGRQMSEARGQRANLRESAKSADRKTTMLGMNADFHR